MLRAKASYILSDCHNSDEIYYLLNAFRLDKKKIEIKTFILGSRTGDVFSEIQEFSLDEIVHKCIFVHWEMVLKVSKSRKHFLLEFSILPKNKRNYYIRTIFHVLRFFEEFIIPKSTFEIYWPLLLVLIWETLEVNVNLLQRNFMLAPLSGP